MASPVKKSSRLSNRISEKRRFLLTGFSGADRNKLAALIISLGGEYLDEKQFKATCTHVVCENPNRSEKFLGGCASGKWIVKKSYLIASGAAHAWVDETDHEWTDVGVTNAISSFIYRAPRKWRQRVEKTQTLAFCDWRIVLLIEDNTMRAVFKRLLEIGGVESVVTKLPSVVDTTITHIFVKSPKIPYTELKSWHDQCVPCLAPDYIGDYIVEDNIPSYQSRDIFLKLLPHSSEDRLTQPHTSPSQTAGSSQSLQSSQGSLQSVCSPIANSRCRLNQNSSSTDQVNAMTPQKQNQRQNISRCELVVKITPIDYKFLKGKTSNDASSVNENRATVSTVRGGARFPTVDHGKSTPVEVADDNKRWRRKARREISLNNFANTTVADPSSATKTKTKRKLISDDDDDNDDVPSTKRARCYEVDLITMDQHEFLLNQQTTSSISLPMSLSMMEIFNVCYEEAQFHQALQIFLRCLSSDKYPTAEMIWKIMSMLYSSNDTELTCEVYTALRRLLSLHPPRLASLQQCHLQAFRSMASNDGWDFITTVIDTCMDTSNSKQISHNSLLLFKYLVAVLTVNISCVEDKLPIISQIIWTSNPIGVLNFRIRHLFSLAVETTVQNDFHEDLRQLVYNLVIVTFTALRLSCKETLLSRGKSADYIAEFTRHVVPYSRDLKILSLVLKSLNNTLLGVGVGCYILDLMNQAMCSATNNDINLRKILRTYLYCVPERNTKRVPFNVIEAANTNSGGHFSPGRISGTPFSGTRLSGTPLCGTPLSKALLSNINKQNRKGESKLHIACMKGNITLLRKLITVIGIDVNLQDNAGWTPMHEACNAGHVDCVQALLNYKPGRTIKSYFSPVDKQAQKSGLVNLLACNPEGITPLHDAVINNRIEVVELLLQHGGERLLQARTVNGHTPLDMAETDAMTEVLRNHRDADDTSCSQNNCSQMSSQSSEDMTELYKATDARRSVSVLECQRYLTLFEYVLVNYIRLNDLGPDSTPSIDHIDNSSERVRLKYLWKDVKRLRNHVFEIVVEDGKDMRSFADVFLRLEILAEAYRPV